MSAGGIDRILDTEDPRAAESDSGARDPGLREEELDARVDVAGPFREVALSHALAVAAGVDGQGVDSRSGEPSGDVVPGPPGAIALVE
jgi:hypothetical protein